MGRDRVHLGGIRRPRVGDASVLRKLAATQLDGFGPGAVAATSLGLLTHAAATTALPFLAQLALGLFVLAAAGGATLFVGFHLRQKPLPFALVVGHGLIAATAWALLIVAILQT